MKKFICAIMAIIMLLSSFVCTGISAFAENIKLSVGDSYIFENKEEEYEQDLEFECKESGYYEFVGIFPNETKKRISITAFTDNVLGTSILSSYQVYKMTEGKTYSFTACVPADSNGMGLVVNSHNHVMTEERQEPSCLYQGYTLQRCVRGACDYKEEKQVLEKTNNHNFVYGVCSICAKRDENYSDFKQNEIKVNETKAYDLKQNEYGIITFIPEKDGYYCFDTSHTAIGNVSLYYYKNGSRYSSYKSKIIELKANEKFDIEFKNIQADDVISINVTEHIHSFVKKASSAPSCVSDGKAIFACKCGYSYEETYPKTQNKHHLTTKIKPATLTQNGSIYSACSIKGCSYKNTKEIPKVSTVVLSTTTYIYDGKEKKPSVKAVDANGKVISSSNYTVTYSSVRKNVGEYKVTIKFNGNYSGTVTKLFKITPKNTTGLALTANSKGFTAKWNKYTTQTTGYQIQYATNKNFENAKAVTIPKNSTTSKAISKLTKNKTYYVRIRTYKTVSSKNYYSSWSSYKTIKTK